MAASGAFVRTVYLGDVVTASTYGNMTYYPSSHNRGYCGY